jgi:hypothetical protein
MGTKYLKKTDKEGKTGSQRRKEQNKKVSMENKSPRSL